MTPKELNKKTLLSIIKNKGKCFETTCTHCSVSCLDPDMRITVDSNNGNIEVCPTDRTEYAYLKYTLAIESYNKLHGDDDNGELMEVLL